MRLDAEKILAHWPPEKPRDPADGAAWDLWLFLWTQRGCPEYGRGAGTIYVARHPGTGLHKIGLTTKDPTARLAHLSTGAGAALILDHQFSTDQARPAEAHFHGLYREHREHGEWFRLAPEHLEELRAVREWNAREGLAITTDLIRDSLALYQRSREVGLPPGPFAVVLDLRAQLKDTQHALELEKARTRGLDREAVQLRQQVEFLQRQLETSLQAERSLRAAAPAPVLEVPGCVAA